MTLSVTWEPPSGDFPYEVVKFSDGRRFALAARLEETSFDLGEWCLRFEGEEPVNHCKKCGRADWEPRVARGLTFDGALTNAVVRGWMVAL